MREITSQRQVHPDSIHKKHDAKKWKHKGSRVHIPLAKLWTFVYSTWVCNEYQSCNTVWSSKDGAADVIELLLPLHCFILVLQIVKYSWFIGIIAQIVTGLLLSAFPVACRFSAFSVDSFFQYIVEAKSNFYKSIDSQFEVNPFVQVEDDCICQAKCRSKGKKSSQAVPLSPEFAIPSCMIPTVNNKRIVANTRY